jgi:YVTN family beta-propeller protein
MIHRLHRVAWLAAFLVGCAPAAGTAASSRPPTPVSSPVPTSTPIASPTPPASYVQLGQRQELSLPQPREELASATLDGTLFVIAGFDATGRDTNTVFTYNGSWSLGPPLPEALDHPAAAVLLAGWIFAIPHTYQLIRSVPVPWRGVDHLDFSADGSYLMASTEFAGAVVKVDTVNMQIVGFVQVGGLPVDVRLSPDGSVFYVANQGRGGVSVVDPVAMKEIAFIKTGRGAHGLAVSRDTRSLYVTNRLAGTISVIDFASRSVVATWRIGGSPDMLQLSPDGSQLWTTGRYNGVVYVIDTSSGKLLHTICVGGQPHGLTYFPNAGRFSLGHNGVYR